MAKAVHIRHTRAWTSMVTSVLEDRSSTRANRNNDNELDPSDISKDGSGAPSPSSQPPSGFAPPTRVGAGGADSARPRVMHASETNANANASGRFSAVGSLVPAAVDSVMRHTPIVRNFWSTDQKAKGRAAAGNRNATASTLDTAASTDTEGFPART